ATIGNEIQNHSTTSTEAPNISATPEHPVPDMISEVSSSQTNNLDNPQPDNLDNPQPDNLDKNNADDIQDFTSEILQEHEKKVPRKGAKYPMANIAEGNLSNNAKAFAVRLCSEEIPLSFEQALKSEKWKKAMDDEMKALKKNKTWDQCALPQGKKPVGCRWIFTVKYKPDRTVERYKARKNRVTCLIIYVDDMVITGNDEEEIKRLKEGLFTEFEIKDLGNLKYFLGIEVLRSPEGIFIYIAHAVGVVSRFMHQPQVAHMNAALRIVRYLKGTAGHGVLFRSNRHLNIQMYTDADGAGDKGNRRSTSGYFSLVGGNLVTWRSKKQKVVSLSSTEAEFRGIAKGLAEALWIRKLVSEIGFPPRGSTQIMCDNKAAIQISENPVQHDRTKHVEVDRHFIK
nr:putative ribonuclease H-like domain-containing protein [Tanacetum cinerariifolium]